MSDNIVSAAEARAWLDPSTGPKPEVPSPLLVDRYARTIVHQAEQTERLQKVEEVLARLDHEYAAVASRNPRPERSGYAVGFLAGIDTAYAWLWKALEVPNE